MWAYGTNPAFCSALHQGRLSGLPTHAQTNDPKISKAQCLWRLLCQGCQAVALIAQKRHHGASHRGQTRAPTRVRDRASHTGTRGERDGKEAWSDEAASRGTGIPPDGRDADPGGLCEQGGGGDGVDAAREIDCRDRVPEAGSEVVRKGGSTVTVNDPANKKALDGLLSWHKKVAGKKLAFPKVTSGLGGFVPGRISGTIVPPFNFADSIPTLLANVSDPTLSVSASVNGQISASAVTSQTRGFNGGSEYARVGIFFHPMTPGTLTISASPTYSFQWSTNSLNSSLVTSSGSVGLTIYGMTDMAQILATAGTIYESWQEDTAGQLDFDFGLNVQKSLSVSLDVTPSLVYICFVEVFAHVIGMGWPGSLASAMAAATVPSISYVFDAQQLVMA